MLDEYSARQCNLIVERILKYEDKKICLSTLVGDLKALISSLEDRDITYYDFLKSLWWDLEQDYAFFLETGAYRNNMLFSEDDTNSINVTLNKFKEFIKKLRCNSEFVEE